MSAGRARLAVLAALGLFLLVVLLWPTGVDAQCGTQASSCKNCHEVQGQAPVAEKGAWHAEHAFGDFCEFCHAGNVTATEADAAHQGMIYPLSDVAASCSSCHPMDYQGLAAGYAETLGVEVGSGTASAAGGTGGGETNVAAGEAEGPAAADASPAEEIGGAVIDLNTRYEDMSSAGLSGGMNAGNVILIVLLVGLVGAFGVSIWHFEGLGERWAALRGTQPAAAAESGLAALLSGQKKDLSSEAFEALLPALQKASPATLASLSRLLEADPERAGQMIEALARIDPRLVEAARRLDERDLELLTVLVRELKERQG
ncbi:MAG: hypothetical protein Kow00124_08680 [Anaerolineae bacterium]